MKKKKQLPSIEDIVYGFKTKYPQGFTAQEREELFALFPKLDHQKFGEALGCITVMTIDGEPLIYPTDIITGIRCAIENRDVNLAEFD